MFDRVLERMPGWRELEIEKRYRAKKRFEEKWENLAGNDRRTREERKLLVGIGRKR